jgi:transglutaminase-like putative cysteine protease
MPLLTIHHKTEYTYANPVGFGEHRIMLRPRDGHDLRVLEEYLDISPTPSSLRRIRDVFGNTVAIAKFNGTSKTLTFNSRVKVLHKPTRGLGLSPEDYAYLHPFAYDEEEAPDLALSIQRQYEDPERRVEIWARQFLTRASTTRTQDLLADITHAIKRDFVYRRRYEPGVQDPLETLRLGTGTCRDFAVFMMEAVRSLGFAARFVSGYIYVPSSGKERHVGGGSTHAWVQVYLPAAGWVEFDPTNGIVGNRDLIRVAIAREPRQAIPLWGTYTGASSDHLGMNVSVKVVSEADV